MMREAVRSWRWWEKSKTGGGRREESAEGRAALHILDWLLPKAFQTFLFCGFLFPRQAGFTLFIQQTHTHTHAQDHSRNTHWYTSDCTQTHGCSAASERCLVMKQFICKDSLSNWLTSGSSRSSEQRPVVCVCVCCLANCFTSTHCCSWCFWQLGVF